MDARRLIEILSVAQRLKDATRHCYTTGGRHESVAFSPFLTVLRAEIRKDTEEKINSVNQS